MDFLAATRTDIAECKTNRGSYDRSYDTSTIFPACLETLKRKVRLPKTSSDRSFTGQVRISTEKERKGGGREEKGKREGGKGKILRALHITLLVNSIFKTGSEQCPYILALAMAVHSYRCMSCSFVRNFTIKRSTPILQRVTTIFTISSRFR